MPGKKQQKQQQIKDAFIVAYSQNPNISKTCEVVKINRAAYYEWMKSDDDFKEAVLAAEELGVDAIEEVARKMAMEEDRQIVMFLLRHKRPNVYGEKIQIDANVKHSGEEKRESVIGKLFKNKGEE